eukprot:TRINITY_DN32194_c0_g1_i1.p1 TRINITY_DN32194_c0_g1~~TRINITY_DN32194_c0_g1_i1.p1  ORF type:complete len:703 (-),score=132.28 TRINITY_DN32194_c0_g1_i1:43-1968(-)
MEDSLGRSLFVTAKDLKVSPGRPVKLDAKFSPPLQSHAVDSTGSSNSPRTPEATKGFSAWAPPPPVQSIVGSPDGSSAKPREISLGSHDFADDKPFSIIPNQVEVDELKTHKMFERRVSETSEASESSRISGGSKLSPKSGGGGGGRRASTVSEVSLTSGGSDAKKIAVKRQLSLRRSAQRGRRGSVVLESEDEDKADANDSSSTSAYNKFVSCVLSWQFELCSALVIFCDLALMGVQTDYTASSLSLDTPAEIRVLQRLLVPFFVAELFVRIAAEGKGFFCERQRLGWNAFDVMIVVGAILETTFDIISEVANESGEEDVLGGLSFRFIRMIRILRLIRILRVARIIRFVTPLRTLVMCITSTLKSLVWSLVLLGIIVYGMAILFTGICTDYRMTSTADTAVAKLYLEKSESTFGNLGKGILTLVGVISNGRDWGDIAAMMFDIDPGFGVIFFLYIAFCIFAVLNVMTGVFCQAAIESAQRDQDLMAETLLSDKARDVDNLRTLFESMDANGDGMLDLLELEDCFDDPQVRALFASLDIHLDNAWQLFNLMDSEGQGEVNAMDFVDLCFKVKGHAKTIDIACLTKQNKEQTKKIRDKLAGVDGQIKEQEKMLREIWNQVVLKPSAAAHRPQPRQMTDKLT